jgi:predicted DNA-binding transcriptional regulator YafY
VPRNDQIIRILSVARALAASRRGVSLKALAEREGWKLRNVYRDRDALLAAGFPIEEPAPGRYRLREDWAAPNLPGVDSDEVAAFFALRALTESWRTTALGKPLDRLWAKLTTAGSGQTTFVPKGEPWFTVRSPLAIDYRAHGKVVATFERATRERLVVACRYQALSTGELTAREIEPGELYWDPGLESLYVIGWCRLRQDVRVFAVHRFAAVTLTEQRFLPKPGVRSKAVLKDAFRVWRGDAVEKVRVRFSRSAAGEIRERTWGPGQRIEDAPGGEVVLTVEVAGLVEVARWVMGFGGEAEVIDPAGLRTLVAERLGAGAGRYDRGRLATIRERRPARAAEDGEEELTRDDKGRG